MGRSFLGRLAFWSRAARHSDGRLRLLLIDDGVPDPVAGAGAPRAFGLIRALLRAGVRVTLFPTVHTGVRVARELVGIEAIEVSGIDRLASFLRARHADFDAIIVSRRHNLIALNEAVKTTPAIAAGKAIVFDSEAIFAEREDLQRALMPLPPGYSVAEEVALARNTNLIIAVNERDAQTYRKAGYSNVRVLGHAITPVPGTATFERREDILFVGPAYQDDTPNSDAVVWFVDHVLPLVGTRLDRPIALTHVGHVKSPAVRARVGEAVDAKGTVNDLVQTYDRARVFVAPIRFAAGISWKVCEAASRGVPCVITPVLARQLGWTHQREALIAETPEAFADACVRLYTDPALWSDIRATALSWVEAECDPERFDRTVGDICAEIGSTRRIKV